MNSFFKNNRSNLDAIIGKEPRERSGYVLIEKNTHPVILHSNAIVGLAVGRARKLHLAWQEYREKDMNERVRSYYPDAKFINQGSRLSILLKLYLYMVLLYWLMRYRKTKNIVNISFRGVNLGDIIYDCYLAGYQVATIKKCDAKLAKLMRNILFDFVRFDKLLKNNSIKAVVVSHTVGIESGLLFRAALKNRIETFQRIDGHAYVGVQRYKSYSEMYNYLRKPSYNEINYLKTINTVVLEKEFNEYIDLRINTSTHRDARLAYDPDKRLFNNRIEFAEAYNVNVNQRNVFIMLHAFTDHPHSHFRHMLFQDYFCWFKETLDFARSHTHVNWIFKEHPSSKYYPTYDVNLQEMFSVNDEHIVFISKDTSFNSLSLVNVADVVLTVLGTAGVEFAAMAGIPTVIAGDTFYDGFGFTLEPKSKKEYFELLKQVHKIPKLTKEQQYMAKMVLLYIVKYHRYPFAWGPNIPYEFDRDPNLDDCYWDYVNKIYIEQPKLLQQQFNHYVNSFALNTFDRLTNYTFS